MTEEPSYSLKESAEFLGISKRTLQRKLKDGFFPGRFLTDTKFGMQIRIPRSELLAFSHSNKKNTLPASRRRRKERKSSLPKKTISHNAEIITSGSIEQKMKKDNDVFEPFLTLIRTVEQNYETCKTEYQNLLKALQEQLVIKEDTIKKLLQMLNSRDHQIDVLREKLLEFQKRFLEKGFQNQIDCIDEEFQKIEDIIKR